MWELIRANQRRSMLLFLIMGIVLLGLGFLIGYALAPEAPLETAVGGMLLASIIWVVMSVISIVAGKKIILAISKAKEVKPEVHPQLFNVVEEMKIAAGLPKMPKIYIINEEAPNAFAAGYSPNNAVIAVTSGLLARLNRDELQGVVAHEMAHIINRDVRFMTIAGILLGSIVMISQIFLRSMIYSSGSKRYSGSSSKGDGKGQIVILIIAIAFAILAPIAARLLYFSISRKREYLADASAVRLTRYPEGLASALEKISSNKAELSVANEATAGMYIINPLKKKGMKLKDLTSTHPPISERIKILRSVAGGAGYLEYQNAWQKVKGTKNNIIPPSGLKEKDAVESRDASAPSKSEQTAKENKRVLGDIMMTVSAFSFLSCACGIRMKVPPDFKHNEIQCPACGKLNAVK